MAAPILGDLAGRAGQWQTTGDEQKCPFDLSKKRGRKCIHDNMVLFKIACSGAARVTNVVAMYPTMTMQALPVCCCGVRRKGHHVLQVLQVPPGTPSPWDVLTIYPIIGRCCGADPGPWHDPGFPSSASKFQRRGPCFVSERPGFAGVWCRFWALPGRPTASSSATSYGALVSKLVFRRPFDTDLRSAGTCLVAVCDVSVFGLAAIRQVVQQIMNLQHQRRIQ